MHSYFRYLFVLFLGCASSTANAWDWIYHETTETAATFYPQQLAMSPNSGLVALGRANNDGVLVSYATDGSIRWLRSNSFHDKLTTMTDGGVVTAGTEGLNVYKCTARRYDADGNLRWISATSDLYCSSLLADGGGSIWLLSSSRTLFLLAADGRIVRIINQLAALAPHVGGYVADPDRSGIYVANSVFDATANASAAGIVALDEQGLERWHYRSATTNNEFFKLVIGSDGSLYGVGTCGSYSLSKLYIASLTRDGNELWSRCYTDIAANNNLTATAALETGIYVFSQNESGLALRRLDSNGDLVWTRNLDIGYGCTSDEACVLTATASGEILALTQYVHVGTSTQQRIVRIDSNGNMVSIASLVDASTNSIVTLADGSALAVTGRSVIPPGSTAPESVNSLMRFARDGSELTAPNTANVADIESGLITARLSLDGTAYLFTSDHTTASYALTRVSVGGQRTWRSEWMGSWFNGAAISNITDRVCVAGERAANNYSAAELQLECTATDSGVRVWQTQLHPVAPYQRVLGLHLADDDTVHIAYIIQNSPQPQSVHFASYDRLGNLLSDIEVATTDWLQASTVADDGSVALGLDRTNTRIVVLRTDGSLRFSTSVASADLVVSQLKLVTDGSVLVLGDRIEEGMHVAFARFLEPNGQLRWMTRLGPLSTPSGSIAFDETSAYLALGYGGYFVGGFQADPAPLQISRLSLVDGTVNWQRNLQGAYLNLTKLVFDAPSGNLLIANAWRPGRVRTYVLDSQSGATVSERFEGCAATDCRIAAVGVMADGSMRAVLNTFTYDSAPGNQTQIYARSNAMAAPEAIRLDQLGIQGNWYAPYSTGQGFMIDYFPINHTLFMPWFTYAGWPSPTADPSATNNDPAGQRWYSLQGEVESNAISAELNIVENVGGAFDAGPITNPYIVGTATLTFSSCSSGSLSYHFNPEFNGGAQGLITLVRLTPATQACILPDGSQMAVPVPPPSNGFDARQSGSWYAPETSGQGLMFTVQPGGLFFAAWFTYDPARVPDEASQQHWFTLQGDLGSATNGAITLPIIQTIGGTFDLAPTSNSYRVGEATLSMQGCDRAQLSYRFDASIIAVPYASRQGSITLEKIGGCGL